MKEKLAKNDTTSNKDPKLDVYVASFEVFLNKHKAHKLYFKEWQKHHDYNGTANVFYAWREWAVLQKCEDWIANAFFWRGSKKGFDFWTAMDLMWINFLKTYHKK